jgi:pilus assembly protein CpaC
MPTTISAASGRGWSRLGLVAAGVLLGASGLHAQQTDRQAPAPNAQPAPSNSSEAVRLPPQTTSEVQALHLLVGRSLLISSPTRIKRVSLADPSIANAIVVSPNQVVLDGIAPGGTSFLLWDENEQSQTFDVLVDIDIASLSQKIHEAFPTEPVQVEAAKDVVMLSGKISSIPVMDKILEIVKAATPKVTNLMEGPAPPVGDILLEVKFAEVDRTAISQFGVNLLRTFGSNMPMSVTTQEFAPPTLSNTQSVTTNGSTSTTTASGSQFLLSNLLNIAIFRPDINLAAFIQALEEKELLQILAEPNLLTASGKDASFLAGGEFPYPVIQSTGGGGSFGGITIQFKEFGVRLNFTPTLEADGYIHLKVQPEVSSLDFSNALQISGFTIPALSTRRVISEMDLKDGQSFVIAGLIDNQVTQQLEKIPGIGDIPLLGKLFQSKNLNKSRSELLVVVTPRVVQGLAPGQAPAGPTFPVPFLPPPPPPKAPGGSEVKH